MKRLEVMTQLDKTKKILIQCDFDGTITKDDVSFMLLDAFAKGDWRAINKEYSDGNITVGQFNEKAFAMVRAGKKTMLDYLEGKVAVRRGLTQFVEMCHKKDIRLVIVSNGLDFYIKRVLEENGLKDVEYHAAETRFHANKLKVRYISPDGNTINAEFKDEYVHHFINEGYQVVYIGNGSSDFSAAAGSHQIFATESLLENCQRSGLNCIPFTSFLEINQVISSW